MTWPGREKKVQWVVRGSMLCDVNHSFITIIATNYDLDMSSSGSMKSGLSGVCPHGIRFFLGGSDSKAAMSDSTGDPHASVCGECIP